MDYCSLKFPSSSFKLSPDMPSTALLQLYPFKRTSGNEISVKSLVFQIRSYFIHISGCLGEK